MPEVINNIVNINGYLMFLVIIYFSKALRHFPPNPHPNPYPYGAPKGSKLTILLQQEKMLLEQQFPARAASRSCSTSNFLPEQHLDTARPAISCPSSNFSCPTRKMLVEQHLFLEYFLYIADQSKLILQMDNAAITTSIANYLS